MRLAFVYLPGRRARLAELSRHEMPTEFFYGAAELAAAGHTVEHFEFESRSPAPLLAAALDGLRRTYLTPPKVFGHVLVNAWLLAPRLNAFDCVVATAPHHAFAFAACTAAGRLRAPLVSIQCGLLHYPYPPQRRAITRRLMNRMDSMFFGEAEHAPLLEKLGVDPARVVVNQFGVDADFWTPSGRREDFVLAVGNDPRRDYATLLAAAAEIAAPIRIVTRLALPDPLPANVTVLRGSWHDRAISDTDMREFYRRAACVVTPLQDTLQPSGQSVTLQAMACGAPVVLTDTRGLWNRDALRDGENVRLAPPAQPHALAAAVRETLKAAPAPMSAAGRDYVMKHAHIASFARGIGEACERAVARR
jgi:glycosyltransferase involved in cell wall biosynthesis